jgi:hypothetical protein
MKTDGMEKFPRFELDLPLELEEAFKIQEALKPLKYEVRGYKKKNGNIILHLSPIQPFVSVSP